MCSKRLLTSLVVLVVVVACGGGGDDPMETSLSQTASPENEAATTSPSPPPAKTESPAPVDPSFAYAVWLDTFEGTSDSFTDVLGDALELSAYWIDSVDRATYEREGNLLVVDATISFESIYMRDPQEWRDDTWRLYGEYARVIWEAFRTPFEESLEDADLGVVPNWELWTPGMLLIANVGRLTVGCPGDLIHRIQQRDATQAEFQTECTFSP